jgi:hypothetical protein
MANETHTLNLNGVSYVLAPMWDNVQNKCINVSIGAIDINKVYDFTLSCIQQGSNLPSAAQYGSLLTLPYRKPTGNSIPDFGAQILIPNGDDSKPHLYFRTSHSATWDAWKTVLDSSNYTGYTYAKSDIYTKTETDNKIAALVDSAPETLNTLNELAAALGDDPNFATTIATTIGTKANKDGSNATGTWGINISGNAASASSVAWGNVSGKPKTFTPSTHTHTSIVTEGDNRAVATKPTDYSNNFVFRGLKNNSTLGIPTANGTYSYLVGLRGWSDKSGGGTHELAFNDGGVFRRSSTSSADTWGNWLKLLDSSNYTDYTVKKDGTGATGTWGISITGNAATASSVAWTGVTGRPTKLSQFTNDKGFITASDSITGSSGSCTGNAATASSSPIWAPSAAITTDFDSQSNITAGFNVGSKTTLHMPSTEFGSMNGCGAFMQFGTDSWKCQLVAGNRGYDYLRQNNASQKTPEGLYFRKYGESTQSGAYTWTPWREIVSIDNTGTMKITHLDSTYHYSSGPTTKNQTLTIPYATSFSNGITGNVTGNVTGNCSGSSGSCTGNAATATALTTKSKGSATNPIYWDANGKPVACTHSLNKTVPADAVFTDSKPSIYPRGTTKVWPIGYNSSGQISGALGFYSDVNIYMDTTAGYLVATRMTASGGFYESSDERLKNFGDKIPVDLEKISKLKKNYFKWKNDSITDTQIGVSAQEIQELYPELVSTDDDGHLTVAYDKLAVVALAAVDELYKKNQELESRIQKLEEVVNKLID